MADSVELYHRGGPFVLSRERCDLCDPAIRVPSNL